MLFYLCLLFIFYAYCHVRITFVFREAHPKWTYRFINYIDYTTTTLSHRLTYQLAENSAIKQHLIIKYNNSTNQLTFSDVRKILADNTMIMYKNNNKKRLQILEAKYMYKYIKMSGIWIFTGGLYPL